MALDSNNRKPESRLGLTLESWSQGFMIGAILVMVFIAVANIRKGVPLHKLIVIELLIALPDCFFIFFEPPVFGWYLSSSSMLMITSWTMHNIIAWMKNKPFLKPWASRTYLATILLVQPYWIMEIYANFGYFNGFNTWLFPKSRPFEAMCRDPWWIITTVNLFWNIKYRYGFGYFEVVRVSPRFGLMLLSMCMSVIFIIVDIMAVTPALKIGGLNPFWKIAFVFKCFTDTIVLDDFKTALDRLTEHRLRRLRSEHHPAMELARRRVTVDDEEALTTESLSEPKAGVIHVEKQFGTISIERGSMTESMGSGGSIVKPNCQS